MADDSPKLASNEFLLHIEEVLDTDIFCDHCLGLSDLLQLGCREG